MRKQELKKRGQKWFKIITDEEEVAVDLNYVDKEVAYCDMQIDNANATILEMEEKKNDLEKVRNTLS